MKTDCRKKKLNTKGRKLIKGENKNVKQMATMLQM